MSKPPHIVFLDGFFYYSHEPAPDVHGNVNPAYHDLRVRTADSDVSVYETLRPLDGSAIRLLIHSLPLDENLFYLAGDGVLSFTLDHEAMSGGWELDTAEDDVVGIPFGRALNGHNARVVAIPLDFVHTLGSDKSELADRLKEAQTVLQALQGWERVE